MRLEPLQEPGPPGVDPVLATLDEWADQLWHQFHLERDEAVADP